MRTLKEYFKNRNLTRKKYSYFKENLINYLTPEELQKLPFKNNIEKYKKKHNYNLDIPRIKIKRPVIDRNLVEEIRKHFKPQEYIFNEDEKVIVSTPDSKSGYKVLKELGCKNTTILDLHHLGKGFPYFNVASMELSPSGENLLLTIDFIGSRIYHLFIKPIYSNELTEIEIPNEKMIQTTNLLSTASSQTAYWVNDNEIIYASINKYYNDSTIYLYDISKKKHKFIYKTKPGFFIDIKILNSNLYIISNIQTYDSDEIYLIDMDSYKMNKTPIIKRQDSVKYNYINHEKGLWHLQIQRKGVDTIETSTDLKHFKILYKNDNPYEQILEFDYYNECYLFTLATLTGIKLYALKCDKLVLIDKSEMDHLSIEYFTSIKNEACIYRHKYTCPYQKQTLSLDTMTLSPVKMNPRYIEKELYIRKDLRVTLIYKTEPHLSRCLLRGYGGYNTYESAHECSYYYPLIERGFVIAISHLRGGGEYGFKGYSEGRRGHKKNTFSDFIETAHFLFSKKITCRDKLAIWGRSFGGLLISSVLNTEPDLCKVALLGVPFVSTIKTLKTYKTPLGLETQSELGNPDKVNRYLKSYDPIQNIKDATYPNMLIYTNINDTLVPYNEPYEYYKKMKELPVYTSGKRDISFFMDYRFGHTQGSLIKDKSEHYGLLFTFLLKYI